MNVQLQRCKNLKFILIVLLLFTVPKIFANKIETKQEINDKIENYYNSIFGAYTLPETLVIGKLTYTDKVMLIAKLINAEAANEPLLGKIAIVNVLVNRAKRKNTSIRRVIYQRDKKGNPQFDGIDTKRFHNKPSKECIIAAKRGLVEEIIPSSVEFFHNPKISTDKGWVKYIEQYTYKDIGKHRFCHNPKKLKKDKYEESI